MRLALIPRIRIDGIGRVVSRGRWLVVYISFGNAIDWRRRVLLRLHVLRITLTVLRWWRYSLRVLLGLPSWIDNDHHRRCPRLLILGHHGRIAVCGIAPSPPSAYDRAHSASNDHAQYHIIAL